MQEDSMEIEPSGIKTVSIYSSIKAFQDAQVIAKQLSESELVPKIYRGKLANCMIALEMSIRLGISPFMVMQNLEVYEGKPSWKSAFVIAALNSCGRFKPLRFEFSGEEGTVHYGCKAVAIDIETGDKIEGPKVTWGMVTAEGWDTRQGSKWNTMGQLMFMYRSATMFGRLYAPDILKGMGTIDENIDISKLGAGLHEQDLQEIITLLDDETLNIPEEEREHFKRIVEQKEIASYKKALTFLKAKKAETNG